MMRPSRATFFAAGAIGETEKVSTRTTDACAGKQKSDGRRQMPAFAGADRSPRADLGSIIASVESTQRA